MNLHLSQKKFEEDSDDPESENSASDILSDEPPSNKYCKNREAQLQFLRQSTRLEESVAPYFVRRTGIGISLLIWLFLIWAVFTKVEEIAQAPGEVVPNGFTQIVQHYDGGLVQEIHVQEGSFVQKGDLLILLNGAGTQEELNKAIVAQKGFEHEVGVAQEMFEIREKLHDRGLTSKVRFLDSKRALVQAQSQLKQQNETIYRLQGRVKRLEIQAPVTGLVKGIKVNTIGGVVKPGEALMEILPVEKHLVVEARISPQDIGHVSVGQPVKVKVSAYDFGRFGAVDGTLKFITASTFSYENGEKFYRCRVELAQNFVGDDPARKILPGMTVQAGIITGEKTILQYLLKPIQRALSGGLSER